MRKSMLCCLVLVFLYFAGHAQDNNKQLELSLRGSYFLIYDHQGWGVGADGKILFPTRVGDNAITVGLGVDLMHHINYPIFFNEDPPVYSMINASLGFRKRFYMLYIEPVAALGLFHEKRIFNDPFMKDRIHTYLNFYGGVSAGIERRKFNYGLDVRINYKDPFKDDVYFIFGLKAAYRFGKRY